MRPHYRLCRTQAINMKETVHSPVILQFGLRHPAEASHCSTVIASKNTSQSKPGQQKVTEHRIAIQLQTGSTNDISLFIYEVGVAYHAEGSSYPVRCTVHVYSAVLRAEPGSVDPSMKIRFLIQRPAGSSYSTSLLRGSNLPTWYVFL